jgi:hypothetical protein
MQPSSIETPNMLGSLGKLAAGSNHLSSRIVYDFASASPKYDDQNSSIEDADSNSDADEMGTDGTQNLKFDSIFTKNPSQNPGTPRVNSENKRTVVRGKSTFSLILRPFEMTSL